MRLSISVVFSSLIGYLLGVETIDYGTLMLLALGGYFMVGASNGFNQILYTCAYTPLKTKTPLAVFVGAIPGAIPFMLGWVAATDDFGIEPGTLFALQFFWQFPHFWAIGWFLFEDYKKGGFFMLPTGKQDKGTAVQTIMYTIWTILISILPVFGFTGRLELSIVAAVLVFGVGLWFLYYAISDKLWI